jgi:hypothetical protein
MNFFSFLQLDESEQIEVLWYNGEQIGRRREQEYLILLYQVEGFYVEVFYHTKLREIKKYLSFECTDRLEPYFESIDITPVYRYIKRGAAYASDSAGGRVVSMAVQKKAKEEAPSLAVETKKFRPGFWTRVLAFLKINNR